MANSEKTKGKKQQGLSRRESIRGARPPLTSPTIVISEELAQVSKTTQARIATEVLAACSDFIALTAKDSLAALSRFVADDCILLDPDGNSLNKEQIIAYNVALSAGGHYQTWVRSDVSVRILGRETAVLTGLMTMKGRFEERGLREQGRAPKAFLSKGRDLTAQYRDTNVFVRRGKGWQLVAAHVSRIPEKR